VACLGLYQVLVRFLFNQPSPWNEELIGRLLIWSVALSIVAGFRQGALFSILAVAANDIDPRLLPFVAVVLGCLAIVTYVPVVTLGLRDLVYR
jgi:TRAP-type C4-dicarboxylate transport system permease small subunit